MNKRVDLYSAYGDFAAQVMAAVREDTYGEDIGQNSWTTADEYARFIGWLELAPEKHLLEIASGSGGPALHVARKSGCRVTGLDINEQAVATAAKAAADAGLGGRVGFQLADAAARLPFEDGAFDALICVDSMNHLRDRAAVLRQWRRVLKPGGRALFTDPVLVTGVVTHEEIALRSSIGLFLFAPPGVNERLVEAAGWELQVSEDLTTDAARTSGRWRDARARRREDLVRIEGEERFEGLQTFFSTVHALYAERRLSRFVYVMRKPV